MAEETILTWRIENAAFCWQNLYERLISPTFTIDWLNKSSWNLCLYPKGIQKATNDYTSYFIIQENAREIEADTGAEFELYFLAADGSKVLPESTEGFLPMKKSSMFGFSRFIKWSKLLGDDESHYLPDETLILCCRIWSADNSYSKERTKPVNLFARTRIQKGDVVQQMHINLHCLDEKYLGGLKPILHEFLIARFYTGTDQATKRECLIIRFEIYKSSNEKIKAAVFELILVDENREICFWKYKHRGFDEDDCKTIELSSNCLRTSDYYVPKNLYLVCRCAYTTGTMTQKIEKGDYGNNLDRFFEQRLSNSTNLKQEQPCQTASDALKSLFHDPLFYDAIIKGKKTEFKVHEMILAPRSEVFEKLLKERNLTTNLIYVSDDDDTLQRVIYFLYTDTILDMHWEIAKKLYKAAVKYKIELLKEKCRAYIKKNLKISNVSDIIILIKDVKDDELKQYTKYFFIENEVFKTDEWTIFSKSNSMLAAEYLHAKYKRGQV